MVTGQSVWMSAPPGIYPETSVTTPTYTISTGDFEVIGYPSTTSQVFTLPSTAVNGQAVIVKHGNTSPYTIALQPAGSDTINGQVGFLLTTGQGVSLTYRNGVWLAVGFFAPPPAIGDAFDGSPDFDGVNTVLGLTPAAGVYTLGANILADTFTVRSGIRIVTGGYVFVCRKLYTEAGSYISFNGNAAVGVTGGAIFTAAGHLGCSGGAGGNGASRATVGSTAGSAGGGAGSGSIAGASGAGGAGGAGAGGAYNATTALGASQFRFWRSAFIARTNWRMPSTGNLTAFVLVNGGGGGGGGGVQVTATGGNSAVGGGGGNSAGIVAFSAGVLDHRGTIETLGGDGAAGALQSGVTGSAGGGGGGAGGGISAVIGQVARLGTFRVSGGLGGAPAGSGSAGMPGCPGSLDIFVNGEAI